MGLLIAKNCNSDKINQEPQDPRPAIVQTEPNPRPVPILIPQENIERQREMDSEPQERQENQEETPRNALEAVRAEFSEESITCQRTSLTLPFSRRAFIMHFDHNSRALSNPLTGPSSIQAPTEIFGMIEEEENNENLLAILRHLDSIGIAQQEGRSWGSRVHRYLFEMNERQPGPFFDEECVARTGNALLAASRVITILIERAIGDGQGFGELADSMPPNLQEIFYDRLSIALFENNERFDARFTERALREFSTEQKWDFFERLLALVKDRLDPRSQAG